MSLVRLEDPDRIRADRTGRTPAYFCRGKPITLDRTVIEQLIAEARTSGGDLRLCLHEGPQETFHDMIIVQHAGGYYRPHRHHDKGETWHMLHGRMAVFVFDDDGKVVDEVILSPDANFLYRVGVAQYHSLIPLSDVVAYHESKPGPFQGPGDSIFAPWSPDGSDSAAKAAYMSHLMAKLSNSGVV